MMAGVTAHPRARHPRAARARRLKPNHDCVAASSSLHSVEEELPFSPSFSAELHSLFESHVGRPTPLMEARNLSQSLNNALGTTGVRIWLKREDLCTTGSHCANSAFGQALLARKLGFDRVIVPTGNGQMGVAAAAACASLNLSCEVHMAGSGISLQPANVPFIRARGASLLPAGGENGRLQHADDAAQTSSSQSSGKDAFLFARSCVGNPPYPRIVREFQKCIGREVYEQAHGAFGGAPDALFASVGGGSNALGLFDPFVGLSAVKLYGCTSGSKESCVVGLDSASGPDIAHLMGERMTLMSATDDEALEALINATSNEGVMPALEAAHALAALFKRHDIESHSNVVVCISGHGDSKDLDIVRRERDI